MKNYIGEKFSRLTIIKNTTKKGRRYYAWCVCDCGERRNVRIDGLLSGNSKSCGCLWREAMLKIKGTQTLTHGLRKSRAYTSWSGIIQRCNNPKNSDYKHYGGRGIKVCSRWVESFQSFYDDMGERPKGMSIERKNNNGNYEPSNCRWATQKEQTSNQRLRNTSRFISFKGERMTVTQWGRKIGIIPSTIFSRLFLGMPIKKCLFKGKLSPDSARKMIQSSVNQKVWQ